MATPLEMRLRLCAAVLAALATAGPPARVADAAAEATGAGLLTLLAMNTGGIVPPPAPWPRGFA